MPPLAQAIVDGHSGPLTVQPLLQGIIAGILSMVLDGIAIDHLGCRSLVRRLDPRPVLASGIMRT